MSRTRCVMLLACFCIGVLTAQICIAQIIERTETMNQSSTLTPSGSFLAHDKSAQPIILEWQQTNLFAPEFSSAMNDAWGIARQAYLPVEMQFLKAFPTVVNTEAYFQPFAALFKNGLENVDWQQAEQRMEAILKSHFVFDTSQLSEEIRQKFAQDTCFYVAIKDMVRGQQLGFITFLMRSTYAAGDVKIMSFAVDPAAQNRGLGKLLMSSIFKINSEIKRIFLCTRVTNDVALRAYRSWGFTSDLNPILDHAFNMDHWTFLEYKVEVSHALQKVAQSIAK